MMTNPLTNQPIPNAMLKQVADLARRQVEIEETIQQLEISMEEEKSKLVAIRETQLPNLMAELGLESFSTKDGHSVHVEKFYQAKIPDDKRPAAFAWIRKNGFDAMIKREIKCTFGKGSDKRAEELKVLLFKKGYEPEDKEGVHPMTLKSFVREQIEAGNDLPTDLLGVYVGSRSKVTPATK